MTTTAAPEESTDLGSLYEMFLLMRTAVLGGNLQGFFCSAPIVGEARALEYATEDATDDELLLLEPCLVEPGGLEQLPAPTTTLAPTATDAHGASDPCGSPLLEVLPIAAESIAGVVPVGHLKPPSHTQPSDHVYFQLPGWEAQAAPSVQLVSPANGTLRDLVRMRNEDMGLSWTDWRATIKVCGPYEILFGHVSTVSGELNELIESTPSPNCTEYGGGDSWVEYCSWTLEFQLEAGEVLGTVGGLDTPNTALDFNAFDWSMDPLPFINPSEQICDLLIFSPLV